jgi:hypothetical protein
MNILRLVLLILFSFKAFATEPANVYRSSQHPVSFRYTSTWEPVTAQASSTLVLLYDRSGTGATANLSAIKADRKEISEYDEQYFREVFGTRFPGFKLRNISYVDTVSGRMALVEYDFHMILQGQKIESTSLVAIRLYRGYRYMLVVNSMKERVEKVRPDAEVMFGTFLPVN